MNNDHRTRSRCSRSLAALALSLLGLGIAFDSDAGPFFFYKFTSVADSRDGFPYAALIGFPSINSSGRIAFPARLTGGVEGVFTRLGTGGVNTLADTGAGPFNDFGIETSINSLNTVLFVGLKIADPVVTTLLRGEGNSATPLISTSDDLFEFCGVQINIQGTAAFRATRGNGTHAILAQGAGPLTGVQRTIAEDTSEFSSLDCNPSIDFDGDVAFIAQLPNGTRGIFTRNVNGGTLTQVVDNNNGPFASFDAVALNQSGGLAFTSSLQGSGRGLFRAREGAITQVADSSSGDIAGFSINESGRVAYELSFGANGSAIFLGPGGLFGRLIGTGSVLFGRTVNFVHIDRDALNSTGQIAVWILFTDGSSMIARGDPVRFPDFTLPTAALQLTTGSGSGVDVGTSLPTAPHHFNLSFDLTFLSPGGVLNVKLGDTVLKSIAATEPGVRRHVSIPIDMRALAKDRSVGATSSLRFALSGKPGLSAQIADVVIPGLLVDQMNAGALSRWRVDSSGGGSAAVVDTTRYPVKIRLDAEKQKADKSGLSVVTVTVLSAEGFDASTDIDRSTLRLAGSAPRTKRDKAGAEQPACETRDMNGDKLEDLMCEVEIKALGKPERDTTLRLEGMTSFGLGIFGSDVLHASR